MSISFFDVDVVRPAYSSLISLVVRTSVSSFGSNTLFTHCVTSRSVKENTKDRSKNVSTKGGWYCSSSAAEDMSGANATAATSYGVH